MKKLFLSLTAVFITAASYAQTFNIGPRVGISQSYLKVDETINNVKYKTGDAQVGLHAGAFARIGFSSFFVQPELLFSSTGGKIDLNDPNNPGNDVLKYNYNRVDVPVMVGLKASAFRVGVGPVISFNIDSKDKSAADLKNEIESKYKSATFGIQAGLGVDVWKLVFDLKYETGLGSMTDNIKIGNNTYNFDQRAQQIILSVGFNIL